MIIFTNHARQQMKERGICLNEIEEAIQRGSKELQDGKILCHYKYFVVVTRKIGLNYVIITVKPRW